METQKEYFLEILPNGYIQVLIQEIYYRADGSELTRDNWRTILTPNDEAYARELLTDYYFSICKAVWTDEVKETFVISLSE